MRRSSSSWSVRTRRVLFVLVLLSLIAAALWTVEASNDDQTDVLTDEIADDEADVAARIRGLELQIAELRDLVCDAHPADC